MARGGKRMAHFLVYNEPNLIPLIYHSIGWYPVERQGPEYLLPAYDTMLAHYVKAYDGIHDLFEARGWGTPHVGFTIASLCSYEYDKQLDDLLRAPELGRGTRGRGGQIAECRAAWRTRIDDLARSQLTDPQYDRYLVDDRGDRRHASARAVHQDAGCALRVAPREEARLPVAERLRAVRRPASRSRRHRPPDQVGAIHDGRRGLSHLHPGDERLQHRPARVHGRELMREPPGDRRARRNPAPTDGRASAT